MQQQQELHAAHAGQRGVGAGQLAQALRRLGNQPVGLAVAIAVVDRLQVVQVDQQQAQRAVLPVAARHLGIQDLGDLAAGQQAGAPAAHARQRPQQAPALAQQQAGGRQHRQQPGGRAGGREPELHEPASAIHAPA